MNLQQLDKELVITFFDQQPQPAFWMTPVWGEHNEIRDFEYRYCNTEFYHYTGLTPDRVIGSGLFNSPAISGLDYRERLFSELLHVYHSGDRQQKWLYNPDLERYYSYTRSRVEGGVLTVLQDRTEEHMMMKQLENQKRLMDSILMHSSNGITVGEMIRDEDGKIIDIKTILINEAAVQHTGIPRELYLSKTAAELDPAFPESPYFQMCVRCMETGAPVLTQYHLAASDKWLEVSVSKMDEAHQIYVFTDVTSIKQAQLKVETVASRLEAVFKAAQAGMFIFTPEKDEHGEIIDFRFVITNPNFAAYVGQTPEVLAGALGSDFFPGYLHNGVFDMYKDTFLTGQTLRREVHYNIDGHDLYLDLQSMKVHDEVLVTFTDYTPLKKAQLNLERSVEELKHVNANLEQFVYAASHDLQEPLRKIHFFSDRLKTQLADRLDREEKVSMDRIENAARRMANLIADLLEYSHLSRGREHTEAVDLNQTLRVVLDDLELMVREKDATIQAGTLPVVKGNGRQLQQLFQNLLSNALKYSKPDTAAYIRISAQNVDGRRDKLHLPVADKEYHLIEVQDNGIGFEQENADKIFNIFTRLHGQNQYTGTGVGLSIAKKVLDNHNGFIWAKSKPGAGTTFFVLLPA